MKKILLESYIALKNATLLHNKTAHYQQRKNNNMKLQRKHGKTCVDP